VGPARKQAEEERGCAPDGDVEQQRHAAVVRQLVERERVVHDWAGRGDARTENVQQPGGRGEHRQRDDEGGEAAGDPDQRASLVTATL
jgi:hypothetical protein